MSNYILRDVPPETWQGFRGRAAEEGWPMRALLLRLMQDYADGRIKPSGSPPPDPRGDDRPRPGTP
jgi:hypothetical protein